MSRMSESLANVEEIIRSLVTERTRKLYFTLEKIQILLLRIISVKLNTEGNFGVSLFVMMTTDVITIVSRVLEMPQGVVYEDSSAEDRLRVLQFSQLLARHLHQLTFFLLVSVFWVSQEARPRPSLSPLQWLGQHWFSVFIPCFLIMKPLEAGSLIQYHRTTACSNNLLNDFINICHL